jgi:hypothetical protein
MNNVRTDMPRFRVLLSVFVLSFIISLPVLGNTRNYKHYRIGAVPKERIFEMKDHTDSLYYWMNAYAKKEIPGGLTLVHIDAHTDDSCPSTLNTVKKAKDFLTKFAKVPEKRRKAFFDEFASQEDYSLGIENFIIPAMYMGIVDNFIWLAPNLHRFSEGALWRKQSYFYYLLSASDLKEIDYCNSNCKKELYFDEGCTIEFFEVEKLPPIKGPILLDIDMDTFGDRDTSRFCSLYYTPAQIEIMMDEALKIINELAPDVALVTIADSPKAFSTEAALSKKPYLKQKLTGIK